jgi:hypothetical protein
VRFGEVLREVGWWRVEDVCERNCCAGGRWDAVGGQRNGRCGVGGCFADGDDGALRWKSCGYFPELLGWFGRTSGIRYQMTKN